MIGLMLYPAPTQADRPPGTYVVVYDRECGFCAASARLVQRLSRASIELVPLEDARPMGLLTALGDDEVAASAHFVTPAGVEYHGGEAVSHALRLLPAGAAFAILDAPGVARLRDAGYALVSRHRGRISRLLRLRCCPEEQ
jgi:predicted DCC family thiol-disulfide oxidoreductase YuxK